MVRTTISLPALVLALSASPVALCLPASARADIPPDPDSPDAHCTKAEQCPDGELCPYAFRPGQPEGDWKNVGADCRAAVASKGLERRCRNGGNYSGENLYCPPGSTGSWTAPGQTPTPAPPVVPDTKVVLDAKVAAKTDPPTTKAGMCSLTDNHGFGLLALLGLFMLRRRR
jgi:MYXO-CTERM domain-containing protein